MVNVGVYKYTILQSELIHLAPKLVKKSLEKTPPKTTIFLACPLEDILR